MYYYYYYLVIFLVGVRFSPTVDIYHCIVLVVILVDIYFTERKIYCLICSDIQESLPWFIDNFHSNFYIEFEFH